MEKMKFESKDMREELILQMEKIMPGCIAEGRNAMNFPGSEKKSIFPMQTDL